MRTVSRTIEALRAIAILTIAVVVSLNPSPTRAQSAATSPRSAGQLEQLVAPIALYPDSLLSQVLMASTYPLEVVEAARWQRENSNVTGQALEDAMQKQAWDASVKALTSIPQTLQMMNDKLDWTQQLGDAFLAQQKDVLDAVQRLRGRADAEAERARPVRRVGGPGGWRVVVEFSDGVRVQAVGLVGAGQPVGEVARALGVHPAAVRRWVWQAWRGWGTAMGLTQSDSLDPPG